MRRRPRLYVLLLAAALLAAACHPSSTSGVSSIAPSRRFSPTGTSGPQGVGKLKHLIFIVMENRSFDQYFGTYPGAHGFPTNSNGQITTCIPDQALGHCVKPYHSTSLVQLGGPHGMPDAELDVNHSAMNGFVNDLIYRNVTCAKYPFASGCSKFEGPQHQPDVMSYHTAAEIPNYWAYAQNYVLQDHMFESVDSWTQPSHLFLVSGWSATCSKVNVAMSCYSDPAMASGSQQPKPSVGAPPPYAWTDITYLLHKFGVTWGYFVADNTCLKAPCQHTSDVTAPAMNPLVGFSTVRQDNQLGDIRTHSQFLSELQNGTLPQVSWVLPAISNDQHPDGSQSILPGQIFTTTTINAIMKSPEWNSSAIFLTWDDWGGFYDNAVPPHIDGAGYGLRVPGLMISPWAKSGLIDHQTLSYDAYLKLIEDLYLGGRRLNPNTDGRPDRRPTVREAVPQLGNLLNEFDFNQAPLPPLILNPNA